MKEFSVVTTTYKHGPYIRAALESVLAQDFGDYELIVINDGSPDNTDEEVAKVKDERLTYIRQGPSGLPANSRNKGIRLATGRLIAFFDGDDIWYPGKLRRCYDLFKADSAIDILCHDLNLINEKGKILKRTLFGPYEGDVYTELLLKGNSLGISSTVIKREIFERDMFLFSEDRRLFTVEDYDLWLRLAKTRRYRFYYMPKILGEHRVFAESASMANATQNAVNMVHLLNENLSLLDPRDMRLKGIIQKKKAQVLFGAALALNYKQDFSESVKWHIKAIRECPLYAKPYTTILASLLRIKLGYI